MPALRTGVLNVIRLDRYLTESAIGSRSQVKELIKKGKVTLNDQVCRQADAKIREGTDCVQVDGKEVVYEPFVYFLLNKPAGVVSATRDNLDRTVLDLLVKEPYRNLFPVGRLDKDTEGLLLITNDGELSHRLLSPGRHVPKTYHARMALPLTSAMQIQLEEGVDIGEKSPTKPAVCKIIDSFTMELTITEGKFHQVKRMAKAVGNEVLYLKRLSMGSLKLDNSLQPGEYRKLTGEEIENLKRTQYGKE